ncbi:MAG: FGGY-family carbohydrate kinase [Lachnospiraceae bacterium]|nr:FGGY-family carbohydrate kinase [Lachnospiraceae bacterium]
MGSIDIKEAIENGKTTMGIEFGSTRIKAVLITEDFVPVANGSHKWENKLENNIWTYSEDDIWTGLKDCYSQLAADVKKKYGITLKKIGAVGISAMMHGYMVFDKDGKLLVPFRTWRNTMTLEASEKLTKLFNFHIPQRWSIAHLYQAILKGEPHVKDIVFQTTLEGYIHWKLTGEKVIGIGEASGMFPIDSTKKNYDEGMLDKFDELIADKGFPWKIRDILPKVLVAGEEAGKLTPEGVRLLDESGELEAGIPFCPPEGDAGTGMTATNSVKQRTGNVSAGTSVFAMVVLEHALSKPYDELDIVTTPAGDSVAMVHCNNCTSDLNAWVNLFLEVIGLAGGSIDTQELYSRLYAEALKGNSSCDGLMAYNYFSGEHITNFEEGRPLFMRKPDADFSLANFMRTTLFTALGALKTGMNILIRDEGVKVDRLLGHGGWFNAKGSGQRIMAAAMGTPVSVMETAGEGGPWGEALLASYMLKKESGESLEDYLDNKVFAGFKAESMDPVAEDVKGFDEFLKVYAAGLKVEKAAIEVLK